ncbi:MAG: hypothetical protein HeimC3_40810 [Candidatus Heimdallarchaeota archaeon LC_3]|nr:MAG: hypothetical protein HeimC3_40810 [Candidatus Heimdallarchaeota archaeon LC_3]
MAYATSAYINSFTNSAYAAGDVTAAITLADALVDSYTRSSSLSGTAVIVASSLLAARILQQGLIHTLQKQNMEIQTFLPKLMSNEIKVLLEPFMNTDYEGIHSEDAN